MLRGIDVSHYQGKVDWKAAAAAGVAFGFTKCSEGVSADTAFFTNRSQAAAACVPLGFYHYFHFASQDWGDQAHTFCKLVGALKPGELPPVLDLEDRPGMVHVGKEAGVRKALAWLETIKGKLGVTPIVYADPDFISTYLSDPKFAQYPLWYAKYDIANVTANTTPPRPRLGPWQACTFWQSSEHGKEQGVSGPVDIDWFIGDKAALQSILVR